MSIEDCLTRTLVAIAAVLVPSLGAAQASLDPVAIQRLVAGKSASWVRPDGRTGTITYYRNGRLSSQTQVFGSPFKVEGTWVIRGGRFCRTVKMDTPPTRCQRVVRVSGRTYRFVNDDGSATTTTFN